MQADLSLNDPRNEESFRSWLYSIVLNVSKSYLRDQKRRFRFQEELNDDQSENMLNLSEASKDPQSLRTISIRD